jgi:hypothetical protein
MKRSKCRRGTIIAMEGAQQWEGNERGRWGAYDQSISCSCMKCHHEYTISCNYYTIIKNANLFFKKALKHKDMK